MAEHPDSEEKLLAVLAYIELSRNHHIPDAAEVAIRVQESRSRLLAELARLCWSDVEIPR